MKSLRDSACEYGLRGWHILPLLPKSKVPNGQLVPSGFREATDYLPDILTWWEIQPNGNIGIYCRGSGLVVIDIDPRNGGDVNHDFPKTLEAVTPSGGRHLVYKHPQKPCKGKLGKGIDVKDQGYIVAAPSFALWSHYHWENDLQPVDAPPEILRPEGEYLEKPNKAIKVSSPLMEIEAWEYIQTLAQRTVYYGYCKCPFHLNGKERSASLCVNGLLWSCFGACEPLPGQEVFGGNIITFAAKLWGYNPRPRGDEFLEVKKRLEKEFECG